MERERGWKVVAASVAMAMVIAGCSKSGGSSDSDGASKKEKSTTTQQAEESTTTTEAAGKAPTEEFQAAIDAFDEAVTPASTDRVSAVNAQDLEGLKTAVAAQRTAYYDFDLAVRDLKVTGSDTDKVNDLLAVDGDVIDNLDEYNSITEGSQYNDILYKEVASIDHWQKLVSDLAEEWDAKFEPAELSLPKGYVGAGETIHSFVSDAAPDEKYSFEVPDGFAGEDGGVTLDVRGPTSAVINTGIANGSTDAPKPETAADLMSYAEEYSSGSADKEGGQVVGDLQAAKVDGKPAVIWTMKSADYVSREAMIIDNDEGEVLVIELLTRSQDEFDRFTGAFESVLDSFHYGP